MLVDSPKGEPTMAQTVEQLLNVTPLASESATITLNGDSADVSAGAKSLAGSLRLFDGSGVERVVVTAIDGSLKLMNASGVVMAEIAAATGNLTLGGAGGAGDMFLKDSTGVTRVEVNAQNHSIRLRDASGQDICVLGPNGDLTLGGNGSNGDVLVKDGAGQTRISLNSSSQRVRVFAANGDLVAELGPSGNLTLGGGGGSYGDIVMKDGAGVTRLELDAQNQLMRMRNSSGLEVGRLGDNANLRLGGNGSDGDIVLSDGAGKARIELDADNHRLLLRNGSGQEIARLGDFGNIQLGGNGSDGDVDLRDSHGQRRILISAEDHNFSLFDASGNQIGSLGPDSNLRLGGHGTDGDILLYPSGINDIFSTADATIHLDGQAGDITLRNADCAEEFELMPQVVAEPGTVMALGEDGKLRPSCRDHETGVVGVVSGAGAYQPGIVLDKQPGGGHRRPIALVGKAYVKVTDEAGPIRIGDLLTSSSTEGHAMRATDPMRGFGAVIGKAIAAHASGRGLIPMVIALQ